MVAQWDAKVTADVGEFGGVNAPGLTGEADGAGELEWRRPQAGLGAASTENAPVKGCIVCRQEVNAFNEACQAGPHFAEWQLIPDVVPGDAVDVGKREFPPGRSRTGRP